jgi:tRNA 2-thiouridine synthesizing protein A
MNGQSEAAGPPSNDRFDSFCPREGGEHEGWRPDEEWDAGDMGCGELVMHLRLRLKPMQPGQLFKLIARDPGAREDLPAWCRLTGHRLVYADHPVYVFARREE